MASTMPIISSDLLGVAMTVSDGDHVQVPDDSLVLLLRMMPSSHQQHNSLWHTCILYTDETCFCFYNLCEPFPSTVLCSTQSKSSQCANAASFMQTCRLLPIMHLQLHPETASAATGVALLRLLVLFPLIGCSLRRYATCICMTVLSGGIRAIRQSQP